MISAILLAALIVASVARRPIPVDAYAEDETPEATIRPGVGARRLRAWIVRTWGRVPTTSSETWTDGGRGWDLPVRGAAHGQAIIDALLAPDASGAPHALARRAGIMYMIWRGRMWRAYPWAGQARGTWTPYGGENPHEDHVHLSLSRRGGAGETSLYRMI